MHRQENPLDRAGTEYSLGKPWVRNLNSRLGPVWLQNRAGELSCAQLISAPRSVLPGVSMFGEKTLSFLWWIAFANLASQRISCPRLSQWLNNRFCFSRGWAFWCHSLDSVPSFHLPLETVFLSLNTKSSHECLHWTSVFFSTFLSMSPWVKGKGWTRCLFFLGEKNWSLITCKWRDQEKLRNFWTRWVLRSLGNPSFCDSENLCVKGHMSPTPRLSQSQH